MDWATDDYTRTYADTIFVPEPGHDGGIYLLEEGGHGTDARAGDRIRAPVRPRREGAGAPRPWREGFYGNVVSDRTNNKPLFDASWDPRPMHYNPSAGADWAHLVPPYSARPYGGGPAPSLAFPLGSTSEGQVGPVDRFRAGGAADAAAGAAAAEASAALKGAGAARALDLCLQFVKVLLLVIIVLLLALTLLASGAALRQLERTIREAVGALGGAP